MSEKIEPLVHDLVAWCAAAPRAYTEVLEAWRTSCPRLMVWEEAVERGLVETRGEGGELVVYVTRTGRELIAPIMERRAAMPHAPAAAAPMQAPLL
jgi:hypothetical protein